jgi:hypothetical protein
MKIAEYFEGTVNVAMETVEDDSAVIFMFTKGNNFQFTIGTAGVRFQNLSLEQHLLLAPAAQNLQRLKKNDHAE